MAVVDQLSKEKSSPNSSDGSKRKWNPDRDVKPWSGGYFRYDLIKEFVTALAGVAILVVALAVLFSSPDKTPVTLQSWSRSDPVGFAQTAITELDGTSATAHYGPPYNTTPNAGQTLGPVSLARIAGARIPVNTAESFVIQPLETLSDQPSLATALKRFASATSSEQANWENSYESAVSKATWNSGALSVPQGSYGPVATMVSSLTNMARSGALDGALLRSHQFYDTNYTKPLLFLNDGSYMANVAGSEHLQGTQWGMMNETGSFPGQSWLWLYTMWYQIPPFSHSGNADALVWATMAILTLAFILVPFIPGVRSIPRRIKLYKLIWRDHYRS